MAGSYHTFQLERFGLMDEAASPAATMYSQVPTTAAEASVRQPITPQEDPTGRAYFAGFESSVSFRSAGVDDFSAAEDAMAARRGVKMAGIAGDFFITALEDTQIRAAERLDVAQPTLSEADYMMQVEGGRRIHPGPDEKGHPVILTRNLLTAINEETDGGQFQSVPGGTLAGGWDDTQGGSQDQVPDGFTNNNFKNSSFDRTAGEAGSFQGTVDTANGSDASLSLTDMIPLPLHGATITLSVTFTQLHDDGTNEIGLETYSPDQQTNFTSKFVTVSSSGRKSVTITTSTITDVAYLQVYPVRVRGATAETSPVTIEDACVRPGTADTYVPK